MTKPSTKTAFGTITAHKAGDSFWFWVGSKQIGHWSQAGQVVSYMGRVIGEKIPTISEALEIVGDSYCDDMMAEVGDELDAEYDALHGEGKVWSSDEASGEDCSELPMAARKFWA